MKTLYLVILYVLITMGKGNLNFLKSFLSNEAQESGKHMAVLVAGSYSYWNYRHQADIFHAYQILRRNGVPADNIIVFAYDDIACSEENPFPGQIFNKPDPKGTGFDVYKGVKIDYKGEDVTPKNFLNVLSGNKSELKGIGTERVLESGKNDNLFIYFSDHGATGLVTFPMEELYADDLIKTLEGMNKENKYNQMVFYLEACESGSMFENILPNNIKIYATTASNSELSSYSTYCPPDIDIVNQKHIGTCLGDEYSVSWMEDSEDDSKMTKAETLNEQFEHVKVKTENSPVQKFGDFSFINDSIWNYEGNLPKETLIEKIKKNIKKIIIKLKQKIFGRNLEKITNKKELLEYKIYLDNAKKSVINSRDVKLKYLYQRAQMKNDYKSYLAYQSEVIHMKKADSIFETFNEMYIIPTHKQLSIINFQCLKEVVKAYKKNCQWGEYDLKYVKNIAFACEKYSEDELVKSLYSICKTQ